MYQATDGFLEAQDNPLKNDAVLKPKAYVIDAVTPHGGVGYRIAKRILDMIVCLPAGLILLLPMVIIALAIRLDSQGPALFSQQRLGKDGKPFNIYKFRTMRLDAEAAGPQWAEKNDDRCTKVGVFLRKSHLDELPQILNIIKGDMSLVGPRPERPVFYDAFEEYIHGFRNRLAVLPGLTGLAQISGGYDLKPEEKIVYDMEYIRTQSFWLDIKVIFRTVGTVFTHEGAR